MPLFGKSSKSPVDAVKTLKDGIETLDKGDKKKAEKASEEVSKSIVHIKTLLYGTPDQDPNPDTMMLVATEFCNYDIIRLLVNNLHKIDFERKKDVAQIFTNILRRQLGTRTPTVEHIVKCQDVLFTLLKGYENPDIALTCGMMLRECVRYQELATIILQDPAFYNFFTYVEMSTFDISSDAFSTFKDILTKHKVQVAEYLEKSYERFFTTYQQLLNSENYVTRRQALKLLGELLLDRHNFTVMTRYISNPDNLKLMMNMLREKSRNIQFEAFHVFKVFVANPNKEKPILDILIRNRDRLVDFLSKFHNDRTDDEQFNDEKTYLIKQIKDLKVPSPAAGANPAGSPEVPATS